MYISLSRAFINVPKRDSTYQSRVRSVFRPALNLQATTAGKLTHACKIHKLKTLCQRIANSICTSAYLYYAKLPFENSQNNEYAEKL